MPVFVYALLILNVGMFILETRAGDPLIISFALWPLTPSSATAVVDAVPHFHLWQLVTYAFLHGGTMHLLINMYALWLFGRRMEMVWSSSRFAFYYFFCLTGAGLVQLLVSSLAAAQGSIYPTIGASGGVFGLLLAFAWTFPNERLMLLFPPVVLRAKWLVLIYGGIELWAGITGTTAGVAHFAHLGGMVFGFLLLRYWGRFPFA